jgi:hypothetical protein
MTRDECTAKADALMIQAFHAEQLGNEGVAYRCRRMAALFRKIAAGNLHVKTAYDEACADFEAAPAMWNGSVRPA